MRSLLRPVGVIALGLFPAILISACGDDDDETSNTPVVPIQETSYVVKEPATTTTTLPPDLTAEGDISPVEQLYTIEAGDAVSSIANKFGITMEELANYNEWPEGISHPIYPGEEIRIPPNSKIPSAAVEDDEETETDSTEADTSTETDSTEADTESTDAPPSGSGEDCEEGSYTITADDTTRLKVAEKFDVTVEALDAANANTSGYSGFYPGLQIVIPCVG
jgi:LysM repeat protein